VAHDTHRVENVAHDINRATIVVHDINRAENVAFEHGCTFIMFYIVHLMAYPSYGLSILWLIHLMACPS
jgi:hypothetical protein